MSDQLNATNLIVSKQERRFRQSLKTF